MFSVLFARSRVKITLTLYTVVAYKVKIKKLREPLNASTVFAWYGATSLISLDIKLLRVSNVLLRFWLLRESLSKMVLKHWMQTHVFLFLFYLSWTAHTIFYILRFYSELSQLFTYIQTAVSCPNCSHLSRQLWKVSFFKTGLDLTCCSALSVVFNSFTDLYFFLVLYIINP